MPTYDLDFRKTPKDNFGGGRADYITPGDYRFEVSKFDDKDSSGGKQMFTFTYRVVTKGDQEGKRLIDRFVDVNNIKQNKGIPLQRLRDLIRAATPQDPTGRRIKVDLAKLEGKQFNASVRDEKQDARTVNGTTYPARTVSSIESYGGIIRRPSRGRAADEDDEEEDELDEDEEEEEDEDEEDLDDDEDEDEEEEDEDEDEDDEEEEEEEPEPTPRRRSSARQASTRQASNNGRSSGSTRRAAPAAAASGRRRRAASNDNDDFPFDD